MWKTLIGRVIYKSSGIKVVENPWVRWLQFNSQAFQTVLNKKYPYKPELDYLKPLVFFAQLLKPKQSCMLGLGGAGAAHALAHLLEGQSLISIENNAEVIDVAQRFFKINAIKNFQLLYEEAHLFVENCTTKFDLLFVDLADAIKFPKPCNNETFFYHCKQLLTKDGFLVVNVACKDDQPRLLQYIKKQFASNVLMISLKHSINLIVIAALPPLFNQILSQLKQSREIKHLAWDTQWGYLAEFH